VRARRGRARRNGGGARTLGGTARSFGGGARTLAGTARTFGGRARTLAGTAGTCGGGARTLGDRARTSRGRARTLALLIVLIAVVSAAIPPATANAATALCNVPITMSDGIVLRGNLWLPSAPDGAPASGSYPTVLTVTGYNKDTSNPTGDSCSGQGGIATVDTPATSPPLPDLANSLGGEIRVLHGGRYSSHVLLPVAPD
jgi:predicted acyl esterase